MKGLIGQRRHEAKIGPGLSVEFIYSGDRIDCIWDPCVPNRALSAKELARYRVARGTFMASLAAELGGTALTIEI